MGNFGKFNIVSTITKALVREAEAAAKINEFSHYEIRKPFDELVGGVNVRLHIHDDEQLKRWKSLSLQFSTLSHPVKL